MPLPEDEQRQLQEIEQALYRDDPKFGRLMRATDPRLQYERKLRHALLGVVIGAGLLAAGAVTHRVYLGAAGVVIVLLSLAGTVVSWRRYMGRVQARAFQGAGQDGDGHEAPARADQAGPDDGADGRALASPPGGWRDAAADRELIPGGSKSDGAEGRTPTSPATSCSASRPSATTPRQWSRLARPGPAARPTGQAPQHDRCSRRQQIWQHAKRPANRDTA